MKMFKTMKWGNEIHEKELIKKSMLSVFYEDQFSQKIVNERISTDHHNWHETKEDAIKFLKNKAIEKIERLSRKVLLAEYELDALNIKYPEP